MDAASTERIIIAVIAFIPSLFCSLILLYLKRNFDRRDKKEECQETARIENNTLLLKGVSVSLAMGEVTAEAVVTHTWNGEMESVRKDARQTKKDIDTFVFRQCSKTTS